MKKVNNWWIPDSETDKEVIGRIEQEIWTCRDPLERCFSYLKSFGTAIDIGAWIGDSTELISRKFQNVIAFEPNPQVFECCKKNLLARKISNVELHPFAISNVKGKVPFKFPKSTLSAWIDTTNNDVVDLYVESNTLDSFNLTQIDFIKIDVDSHEGFLLQGAEEFFRNNSPLVMIEHKPRVLKRQRTDMPNALDLMKGFGYRLVEQASAIDYIFTR